MRSNGAARALIRLGRARQSHSCKFVFVKGVSFVTSRAKDATLPVRSHARTGQPSPPPLLDAQGKGFEFKDLVTMADPERGITIALNGRTLMTRAETRSSLLVEQGYDRIKVATALNEEFIPERIRETTFIKPGDRVEVLSARQGG